MQLLPPNCVVVSPSHINVCFCEPHLFTIVYALYGNIVILYIMSPSHLNSVSVHLKSSHLVPMKFGRRLPHCCLNPHSANFFSVGWHFYNVPECDLSTVSHTSSGSFLLFHTLASSVVLAPVLHTRNRKKVPNL